MDDAVDGGAADAVLGGQIGEGDLAFGVAAADRAACGLGKLLSLDLDVLLIGAAAGVSDAAGLGRGPGSNRGKSNGYGPDLHGRSLARRPVIVFLKESQRVSSDIVGFTAVITGPL